MLKQQCLPHHAFARLGIRIRKPHNFGYRICIFETYCVACDREDRSTFMRRSWASCSHTFASVAKRYNLVLVKERRCSAAGKGSLATASLAISNDTAWLCLRLRSALLGPTLPFWRPTMSTDVVCHYLDVIFVGWHSFINREFRPTLLVRVMGLPPLARHCRRYISAMWDRSTLLGDNIGPYGAALSHLRTDCEMISGPIARDSV